MSRMRDCVVLSSFVAAGVAAAGDLVLVSSRDNTLYEDLAGAQSNGKGKHFFVGMTAQPELRRGLLEFDLSGVPAGATIVGCELTLHMSKTITDAKAVHIHRALAHWGEGESDATGEEGVGAFPEPGDATWIHTEYDTYYWTTAGGEFAASPSASLDVEFETFYTWSSPGLAADVQAWVDGAAPNDGWVLVGDESGGISAKRFDTRENPDESVWPRLRVLYVPPCIADWNSDGSVNTQDFLQFLNEWAGESASADLDFNGSVNTQDFLVFLNQWVAGCG